MELEAIVENDKIILKRKATVWISPV
jgi:hypothetical protein